MQHLTGGKIAAGLRIKVLLAALAVLGFVLLAPLGVRAQAGVSGDGSVAHTLMLDVSGSMNDSWKPNSQGRIPCGHYGSIERGFDKNIVTLLTTLLNPQENYVSAGDPLTIMPIMYYGEAQQRAARKAPPVSRAPLSGLTIASLQAALEDPSHVPGPGEGGFGEGLAHEYMKAMNMAAGNSASCNILWMLTDNGAGDNANETPVAFYEQLKRDDRLSYVGFIPLGRLSPEQGHVMLYIMATGALPGGEVEFVRHLRQALNSIGQTFRQQWSEFATPELIKFRPLYVKAQGTTWNIATENCRTARYTGGELPPDSSWANAMNGGNGICQVTMSETEPGVWKGYLRYTTSLQRDGWALENEDFSEQDCLLNDTANTLDKGLSTSVECLTSETEEERGLDLLWIITIYGQNYTDGNLAEQFPAGLEGTLVCQGRADARLKLMEEGQTKSVLGDYDDRNVAHLKEIVKFAFADNQDHSQNSSLRFVIDNVPVLLCFQRPAANYWPYILGIVAILLAALAAFLFLRSRKVRYTLYWRIPKGNPDGSELMDSQAIAFSPSSPKTEVSLNGREFATLVRMGEDINFLPKDPQGQERTAIALSVEYCDMLGQEEDNVGDMVQVFWRLEKDQASTRSTDSDDDYSSGDSSADSGGAFV